MFNRYTHRIITSAKTLLSVLMVALSMSVAMAQLSPGKLTKAHSKLEGLANCTQCHTIGDKISNQKCLSCHKELNVRVSANKGFHASSQVKGKECITCHSEHNGLKFDMVRFDEKTFNHSLTGYELKGAHKSKDCASCHKPDNIVVSSLKSKPNTYLGLDVKCLSCHDDFHQKTLASDCVSCHDFNSFKPSTNFSHAKTDFPLTGAHKNVDCASCHKPSLKNGEKFVQYAGLGFKNCTSCHKDEHKGQFGNNCKACHNDESFHKITPSRSFNHAITGFELEGKHENLDCKKCHDNRNGSSTNFQEFKGKDVATCIACHTDIHTGKFGNDCKSCHNQNSFKLKSTTNLSGFDHDKTNFTLEGKHETVDCRKCHLTSLTEPLAHDKCMSCHKDYHQGDFVAKTEFYPDCATCHSVGGFTPSSFTIEQHSNSNFKLDGAHLATPCFACHFKEEKWIFSKLGQQCVDCHKDIHDGHIDQKFYGNQSCASCHTSESWAEVNFDHTTTAFTLKGKHEKTSCSSCHMDRTSIPIKQEFKGKSMQCQSCHENVHGTQFAIEGKTECSRCHGFESWDSKHFNHENTNFKLEGEHKNIACNKCHKETYSEGKKVTLFKIEKYQCIDCHR